MDYTVVERAADSEFPIQNLPYGVFCPPDDPNPRAGVRIGDTVLDLGLLESEGFFASTALGHKQVFRNAYLNDFMTMGRAAWQEARNALQDLLTGGVRAPKTKAPLFYQIEDVNLRMPVAIGDYTDFYASKYHASNVGRLFRGPDHPLMPNWAHLPVAYHGRASSIVISGSPVKRPWGQTRPSANGLPCFTPTRQLDFELEVGWFIGPGNSLGTPISIETAEDHIFGLVLVNDWSARDIQSWEYQPLGPFLGKNFCTSISPWIIPFEALKPFRVPGMLQDPEPLPYLRQTPPAAFDIHLEAALKSPSLEIPTQICSTNFRHLYWSMAQQIAHHTSNGCNLRTGDLLASGTVSGPGKTERGCLLELTSGGEEPLSLTGGDSRVWLEDGDELIMTAWCQGPGFKVGFGTVSGKILPASPKA